MKSKLIEKQVDVGESTIVYQQGGIPNNSTPVLLIHGWAISAEPYQEILDLLAQHHTVIAPDLPGFARSKSPQPLEDYHSYAKLLLEFISALSIEKVHLIGHSFGGGIAIEMAALSPSQIHSLMLVNSTGIPADSLLRVLLGRAIEMPTQLLSAKLNLLLVDIPQVFIHNLISNPQQVIQALFLSLKTDLRSFLSQIRSPCLILWSEKDLTVPLSMAQALSQQIQGAKIIAVSEGFHEWILLYPKKFVSIVCNFIAQVEGDW